MEEVEVAAAAEGDRDPDQDLPLLLEVEVNLLLAVEAKANLDPVLHPDHSLDQDLVQNQNLHLDLDPDQDLIHSLILVVKANLQDVPDLKVQHLIVRDLNRLKNNQQKVQKEINPSV